MKQLKVVAFTFAGLLIFCLFFHVYTHVTAIKIREAYAELYAAEDTSEYLAALSGLKDETLKYATVWNIMINHTETSSVIAQITTSLAYAENGDFSTSKVSLKQAENAIDKMLDREKCLFSNVF
jgi:hypothetical protein